MMRRRGLRSRVIWKRAVKDRAAEFVTALRKLVADDPKDNEAILFLVDQLCRNRKLGIPISDIGKAGDLLSRVLNAVTQHHARYHYMRLWLPVDPQRAIGSPNRRGGRARTRRRSRERSM